MNNKKYLRMITILVGLGVFITMITLLVGAFMLSPFVGFFVLGLELIFLGFLLV